MRLVFKVRKPIKRACLPFRRYNVRAGNFMFLPTCMRRICSVYFSRIMFDTDHFIPASLR